MNELDTLKSLLSEAEDDYSFAIARGDWPAVSLAKAKVAKLRNRIGRLIKQRMQLSLV